MKYIKISKLVAFSAVVATLFSACDKAIEVDPIGGAGQTLVKAMNGGATSNPGLNKNAIDFVPTPITIVAAEIRRDVPNNEELNREMNIVVIDDTAALRMYNDSLSNLGEPTYTYMPNSWYSINSATPKVGGDGGAFALKMNPGEFVKQIKITIPDATVLDPSSNYALPFTIMSADANGNISESRTVLAVIGAKNFFDGVYELDFQNYHPTLNPGYTGDVVEVQMHTTAGDKCKLYWDGIGGYYNPAVLSGSLTAFGAQEPEYTINTATNSVTVQNAFSGAVTFYDMNTTYSNIYDPVAKTIQCKWGYRYTAGAFDPANTREWTQKFTYTGPR